MKSQDLFLAAEQRYEYFKVIVGLETYDSGNLTDLRINYFNLIFILKTSVDNIEEYKIHKNNTTTTMNSSPNLGNKTLSA